MRVLPLLGLLLIAASAVLLPLRDTLAQDPPAAGPRAAFGTAFGYQGRLVLDGIPANGTFDFEFALYSASTGGTPAGSVAQTLPVTNGLFATELSFGSEVMQAGAFYYIEVRVKQPAAATYTTLTPRQRLSPAAYAVTAGTLPAGTRIALGDSPTGLSIQEILPNGYILSHFGGSNDNAIYAIGGAAYSPPGETSYGGAFNGGTAGVQSLSSQGYGLLAQTQGAARAAVLGEHTGSSCTGGTIGPEDPLQQFCYGVAGISKDTSTHGIGVYGYGTNTAIWGKTDNPAGYSGFFEGGKVRMSDGTVFGVTSDGRLKKDITALSVGLEELLQLKPSTYAWKNDATATPHFGFIAQEVREVIPGVVDEDPDGTLSIEPLGLLPVIVKSIQEQQTQLDALQPGTSSVTSNRALPSDTVLVLIFGAFLAGMFLAGFAGVVAGKRMTR